MNANDDLDLRLRSWMRQRTPLAPRTDLVDGAMARASTVRQRPAILAPSGESAGTLPLAGLVGGRRAILVLGALLLLLAMAFAFVGSRPTADNGRLLVAVDATYHLLEPDGRLRTRNLAVGTEACATMIEGTDVIAHRVRFTGISFVAVGDPSATFRDISPNVGGIDLWSPDGRRLLLVQARSITAWDLADPSRPERRIVEVQPVEGAAVDPSGRWVAIASRVLGNLGLELVDLRTGETRSVGAVPIERPLAYAGPGSVPMSLSPGGAWIAIGSPDGADATRVLLVDTATGASREAASNQPIDLAGARWSHDGRWLAMPSRNAVTIVPATGGDPVVVDQVGNTWPAQLAWSSDAAWLAYRQGGGGLVTVSPDGSVRMVHPMLLGGFTWSPGGDLVVARTSDDTRTTVVERYRPGLIEPVERIASIPIPGGGDGRVPLTCVGWASAPADR